MRNRIYGRLDALDKAVADLESRTAALEDTVNALDAQLQGLDSQVQALDAQVQGIDAAVQSLGTLVADLDDRVGFLEALTVDDDQDGFSEIYDDCDDTDPNVFPGADEVLANGIDDDCDGTIDEAT
jgi:prefoldin subunit 5